MTTQSTLIFSAFFALIAAGIYTYTGWRLGKRVVPTSDARLAWMSFTVWRYGLAAATLIGGLAYFMLYFRVTAITQKYRILLVSWSIIIWFLSPFAVAAGDLSQQDWWQLASRFIGLAAASTILTAYLPPRWLKQRYGIISLNDESQEENAIK